MRSGDDDGGAVVFPTGAAGVIAGCAGAGDGGGVYAGVFGVAGALGANAAGAGVVGE
jgi:hypothetical protein